jgi:hypothetical protein
MTEAESATADLTPHLELEETVGYLVADPAGAIAAIDVRTRVIGLRIERRAIKAFL